MSLSVGAATDHLYGLAQQAVTGVTVNGEAAVAVDGEPDELVFGMFVVGLDGPPPDLSGEVPVVREWSPIGDRWLDEDYSIPCYVDVRVPGREQKAARDLAEGIFNTFWAGIVADVTLGGALAQGRTAEVNRLTAISTNVGTEGEPGRRTLLRFAVHCATTVR